MSWGTTSQASATTEAPKATYGHDYYTNLFNDNLAQSVSVRMALVGRENTAKTGLAASMLEDEINAGKEVYVIDIDNSAKATLDFLYPGKDNIKVLPIHDETDESIFNEDNTINYVALTDKVNWFVNILADKCKQKDHNIGGIIFDGGSTYLKWCEHAMRASLLRRGIIDDEGGSFNQKEWRERNRIFREAISRIHSLRVSKVFYTFHLKPIKEYIDDGGGKKVLASVGERPEWEKGTMRHFTQQVFLTRYMRKADMAAGVKADKSLKDGEWAIKAEIEEMKGLHMEHLGTTHTILSVKDGKANWTGLPFLKWD